GRAAAFLPAAVCAGWARTDRRPAMLPAAPRTARPPPPAIAPARRRAFPRRTGDTRPPADWRESASARPPAPFLSRRETDPASARPWRAFVARGPIHPLSPAGDVEFAAVPANAGNPETLQGSPRDHCRRGAFHPSL